MRRQSRSTMHKIAPFQGIRASLRDAVCFGRFQTRAEARAYVQLPLSRQGATKLSALADSERSPAICFWHFQTRAGARAYGRLPLSRHVATKLSALADSVRSPAIHRRVWLENERLVA